MVEVEVALYHVADDFELRVSWEGDLTREHDVEDDTQRPDVNLRIVVLQEHFWCNVVWRSAHGLHGLLAGEVLRKAKVDHLDAAGVIFACEHEVLGLDVAMTDVLSVEVD